MGAFEIHERSRKGQEGVMRNALALVGALLVACGASASPSPSPALTPAAERAQTPPPAAAPTTAPPAATSPGRAPTATRDPAHAEVILRFDAGAIISDVDDVSDMVTHLKETPGIVGGFGDEVEITIIYDPQQVTVERIRRILADMGFPTRSPSPRP